ncbi:hypothetical protein BC835DRAFT_1395010 [Cytidiella melzeri]|nr:hypothetical protein BC835DRAFT_1395010 [Cytidiella melzeri]
MSGRKSKNHPNAVASSSRTPSFKPPSFYAAAAGLKYSPNVDSLARTSELNSPIHDVIDLTGVSMSYPTGDDDNQDNNAGRGRSSSLSRSFSRANPRQQRQDKKSNSQSHRRSQMAEIPFLETQLLPSLRDTIDRMTHPPRRAEVEDTMSKAREGEVSLAEPHHKTSNVRIDLYGQSSIPTSPFASAGPSFSQKYPQSNPASPSLSAALKTPRLTSSSNYNTPRVESQSPARATSKLPTAVRNASSLRADAALSPASVPIPPSPLPGRSPSHPSRTPRLELFQGSSQAVASPVAKLRSPNNNASSRIPAPGSADATSGPQPHSTPRMRQTSAPFQSIAAQPTPRSIISRPNYATDSGSELENEYRQSSGTGRLVVTNGEISPSSSESVGQKQHPGDRTRAPAWDQQADVRPSDDCQDERMTSQKKRRDAHAESSTDPQRLQRNKTRTEKQTVGLGLHFDSEKTQQVLTDEDVDESRMHGHHNNQYREGHGRGYQQRPDKSYRRPERDEKRGSRLSDGRRRREALLGLVNGLQHEYGVHPTSTYGSSRQDDAQSDEGVVVTESMQMGGCEYFDSVEAYQDHHYIYDDSKEHDKGRNSRNRGVRPDYASGSSSCKAESSRDRRSSSLPPGSRSISRPSGSAKPRQDLRPELVTKQTKARHRRSMSVDQPNGAPRQPPPRSQRTSAHFQDSANENRPAIKSRDSPAREREAFGIPASLSYGGIDDEVSLHPKEQQCRNVPSGPTSDTEFSTAGDGHGYPEVNPDVLSLAAEALFDKLSGTAGTRPDNRQHSDNGSRHRRQSVNGRHEAAEEQFRSRLVQQQQQYYQPRPVSIVDSSSAPSVYEPEPEYQERPPSPPNQAVGTWRSTVRPKVYERLLGVHGALEMERQEVVFRYYHTQRQLWQRLQSTVRIFVLPLRRQHSKNWIPGVPTRAGRLFDWLEDIVNLHHAISEALQTVVAAWEVGNVAFNVARTLRMFVPRLEVYQPYLVRYEEVRQMIAERVATPNDEFGEFIKLQQKTRECYGLALADLLELPISHILTCVETFEQLWRLTTSEHPDHLPAFSLYHSTRMMLHVLWEVKVREEEYDYVKDISCRIEGLLPSVQLATRERRLLWHGDLIFHPPDKRQPSTSAMPISAVLSPPSGSSGWRNGTYSTPAIVLSPCPDDGRLTASEDASSLKPLNVRVFVFTDVVVIGRILSKQRLSGAQWKIVPDVGTARVIGVTSLNTESARLSLQLLPLKQTDLQSGMIPDERSVVAVSLSSSSRTAKDESSTMLDAFRRCFAYTLKSLSFPSHSGQYLPHGPHVDLEHDTQKSVMSILSTGLPLPKSPSIQMGDPGRAGTADPSDDHDKEREERGWWALRFQQVLREVQRQDPMLSLQMFDATRA